MGYAVSVDTGAVAGASAREGELAAAIDAAGEAAGRALVRVAAAAGGGSLAGAAGAAATPWRAGTTTLAARAQALARRTGAGAEDYRAVELRQTAAWSPGPVRETGPAQDRPGVGGPR